ncbi:hypothetical protein GQ53DRAFT_822391 [Thozetella sp. PMI_491]|nr:hypothetical protein GQ53DRAFT_822391 [Thozetella sp. PMI_491]
MSAPLRSKQGCWTCKLRRKKCDETHPRCSICESLSIPCYGFGPRPEWMDGGDNERAVLNSLKEIVKRTSRQKIGSQLPNNRDKAVRIAPKRSETYSEDSSSVPELKLGDASDLSQARETLSQKAELGVQQGISAMTPPASEPDDPIVRVNLSVPAEEAVLLMHFLDNIFPSQYPMFKPNMSEGGRGWLLNLLLQNNPLYYLALAFSSYHRRTTMPAETAGPIRVATIVQQERHLGICISLMNQSVQRFCGEWKGPGIVLTVIELVFFELYTDNIEGWQAHLRAVLHMGLQAHKMHYDSRLYLTESAKEILRGDLPVSEDDPAVAEEVSCFRFVTGTTAWLDITHAVTAGKAPILLPHLSSILSSGSQIQLSSIMGCKNSIMLQIGRICALHAQVILTLEEGRLACAELHQGASSIALEIEGYLTQETFDTLDLSGYGDAGISSRAHSPTSLVTRIFAQMALVYLHLVVHDFQNLELCFAPISEAMKIFKTQIPRGLLSPLVLPLFIIGVVTTEKERSFFRDAFSHPPLLDPMLNHRAKILPILEEIWRRQASPDFGWNDCLGLTHDILLL